MRRLIDSDDDGREKHLKRVDVVRRKTSSWNSGYGTGIQERSTRTNQGSRINVAGSRSTQDCTSTAGPYGSCSTILLSSGCNNIGLWNLQTYDGGATRAIPVSSRFPCTFSGVPLTKRSGCCEAASSWNNIFPFVQ